MMGRDFNNIKNKDEKRDGNERQECSFQAFKNFKDEMAMGDIKCEGDTHTWATNSEGEGFIQERLESFSGSLDWMLLNDMAIVNLVIKPTSDHSLKILDSKPERVKSWVRFIFYSCWIKERVCVEIVKETWGKTVAAYRMFKVKQNRKWCKHSFIK